MAANVDLVMIVVALSVELNQRVLERLSPQHFALVAVLAFTGLRFCHASALRWEDVDADNGVLRVVRKNIRGRVGPVSRKKRAPREYPLHPTLAAIRITSSCAVSTFIQRAKNAATINDAARFAAAPSQVFLGLSAGANGIRPANFPTT